MLLVAMSPVPTGLELAGHFAFREEREETPGSVSDDGAAPFDEPFPGGAINPESDCGGNMLGEPLGAALGSADRMLPGQGVPV